VLVVDVGGGTSDFSLIAILERDGKLEPHRVAVGDHILLGGDNMDLALAHLVARKLAANGTQLDAWQMRALTYACRGAKETCWPTPRHDTWPIVVPSRGSKLIGGSIRTELTRDEVTTFITDGFFPRVEAAARPVRTRAGLTQLGLPYAQDAGRHAPPGRLPGAPGRRHRGTGRLPASSHPERQLPASDGGAVQRRRVQVGDPGPARDGHHQRLAVHGRRGAGAHAGRRRPRPGGGARRGLLRLCAARRRRAHPRRHGAFLLRGVESSMPAIPGMEPPIRPCAWRPSAWKKAARSNCRARNSAWWSASRCTSASSVRPCGARTRSARCSISGAPDELQELNEIQATLPAEGRTPGDVVQVQLHALATESGTLELAPWLAKASAGRSSSTSAPPSSST
jgi:hypothetical protein